MASPSSHNFGAVNAVVHVPWLGGGEMIELVGFYGHSAAEDLGNTPDCHWSPRYDDPEDRIYFPSPDAYGMRPGDYPFSFPTKSGSVSSECPGFHYTWQGSFFVQTNLKAYWINPEMDPGQVFTFDLNLYDSIQHRHGSFRSAYTNGTELKFYNPRNCAR